MILKPRLNINNKDLITNKTYPLSQYLLSTLVTNTLYLGYSHSLIDNRMNFDLAGSRQGVDIHNLDHTLYRIKQVINIFTTIWTKFGCIWCVTFTPIKLPLIFAANGGGVILTKRDKLPLLNHFYIWNTRWPPGMFSNKSTYRTYHKNAMFPNAMFYNQYTRNIDRFREASRAGILQAGVADSTSSRSPSLQYLVPSNEKTLRSSWYFAQLLAKAAARALFFNQKRLLVGWVTSQGRPQVHKKKPIFTKKWN